MNRLEEPLDIQFADCGTCVHLQDGRVCPAFPDGIPDEIWKADEGHRTIRPDQTGSLTYEERPSE